VELIGRLGGDPESRTTANDRKVCTFRLAVDRRWRAADGSSREATEWFNVETWGRLAEICEQYLSKGRLVFLEGRLQTDRYEQDGSTKYFTKVVPANLQMLDRRPGEDGAEPEMAVEGEAEDG
jgi:single-strand DNA-binding protein